MNTVPQISETSPLAVMHDHAIDKLATFYIGDQMFGVSVDYVQGILQLDKIFNIPLGPSNVAGLINLRGHIVTVLDLRVYLGMTQPEQTSSHRPMCITVEHKGTLYGLLVDRVGDVLDCPHDQMDIVPQTVAKPWRSLCSGIYRLDKKLLLILSIEQMFEVE
ncbi:MAG: chemotaxis protein CheW [Magnetovibrio sp.]|nr:chemotaxis protein CheW [Magnetovibrio sp.]